MTSARRAHETAASLDAGQAAVAINDRVVALEAAEGTDAMLDRVALLRQNGRLRPNDRRAGVLAKCAKPQQDLRVDMPTIGPKTIEGAAAAGLPAGGMGQAEPGHEVAERAVVLGP